MFPVPVEAERLCCAQDEAGENPNRPPSIMRPKALLKPRWCQHKILAQSWFAEALFLGTYKEKAHSL